MKKILRGRFAPTMLSTYLLFALMPFSALQAQFIDFSVELVQEHSGEIEDLSGHSTYRVYANFENNTDVLSAIFGDTASPLYLLSPTGFYQAPGGGNFGTEINANLFSAFPALEFDSWLTIGSENSAEAQTGVYSIGMTSALEQFNNGGDILLNSLNGGSWFVIYGNTNAVAGDDLRVLVAQLTVSQSFHGSFNLQSFVNGAQSNEEFLTDFCFSTEDDAVFGCTDATALNYDESADTPCGSCVYPCSLEIEVVSNSPAVCEDPFSGAVSLAAIGAQQGVLFTNPIDGNETPYLVEAEYVNLPAGEHTVFAIDGAGCEASVTFVVEAIGDANGNGICDEVETSGCPIPLSCNYNPEAINAEDCDFESCAGCTYANACNFDAEAVYDDGSCEFDSCLGCTDSSACNYNPEVSQDDGSCTYSDGCEDCTGDCFDENLDQICDCDQSLGCTDPSACNFDPQASIDDGSCISIEAIQMEAYDAGYGDAEANCQQGFFQGQYCGAGTYWDPESNACLPTNCLGDFDGDGLIGSEDLLDFLGLYDTYCPGVTAPFLCGDAVTFDGHEYTTVPIGDQCWFAENLRTEHYANGDSITGNLSDSDWLSTTLGAQAVYGEGSGYCFGNCDEVVNLATYGRLYNWYAVDDARGLCPSGWHVPTDGEWMALEMELGMTAEEANSTGWRGTVQGTQMKSSPSDSPAWDGTNVSGFSALPGGERYSYDGSFLFDVSYGYWWSASPNGASFAWGRLLSSNTDLVQRFEFYRHGGHSVRCVRD